MKWPGRRIVPHLTIEYSPGLAARADIAALCRAAHAAMVAAGIFPLAGIRVRAHCADHVVLADGLPENDFAALTLAVGAGRSPDALHAAGDAIFAAVQGALAGPLATQYFALSLEIRVIDPALSWKDTPIHARLSGQS
jgi:5-carboxymethyl-2-hydroxymuconate isomerase